MWLKRFGQSRVWVQASVRPAWPRGAHAGSGAHRLGTHALGSDTVTRGQEPLRTWLVFALSLQYSSQLSREVWWTCLRGWGQSQLSSRRSRIGPALFPHTERFVSPRLEWRSAVCLPAAPLGFCPSLRFVLARQSDLQRPDRVRMRGGESGVRRRSASYRLGFLGSARQRQRHTLALSTETA